MWLTLAVHEDHIFASFRGAIGNVLHIVVPIVQATRVLVVVVVAVVVVVVVVVVLVVVVAVVVVVVAATPVV